MSHFSKTLMIVTLTCSACIYADGLQQSIAPNAAHPLESVSEVVHIAGLTEVKPDVKGNLLLTPDAIVFSNDAVQATIPRARMLNVFVGDQRTEPWGTSGKIARKVIPYGGGAALGALTRGQVDLLTVESLDEHDGYHGVVFAVPFQKAAAIRDQLIANLVPPVRQAVSSCRQGGSAPDSVLLAPIVVTGIQLPDEYRILLYEQLYKQLELKSPSDHFLRTGDRSSGPGCIALTLHVTVNGFKKGNRALRASTGPVGLFVGTTSLSIDIDLQDVQNKPVFDAHIKQNNRGDSDSLGLADGIAKSVAKRMNKELRKRELQSAV